MVTAFFIHPATPYSSCRGEFSASKGLIFSEASSVVVMATAALTLVELVQVAMGLTWITSLVDALGLTTDLFLTLISDQAAVNESERKLC